MSDYNQEYNSLLKEYRRKQHELREAETKGYGADWIQFVDKERDDIHKKLKKVGSVLGKSKQDVDLDILMQEGDLRSYQLPEFRVLKIATAMDKIDLVNVLLADAGNIQRKRVGDQEGTDGLKLIIPFGRDEYWHLFDEESHRAEDVDGPERKQRMMRAAEVAHGLGVPVEIISSTSFHVGIALYGLACKPEDLEMLLAEIRANREEVSINPRFFDEKRVRVGYEEYVHRTISEIQHMQLGPHETRGGLIARFRSEVEKHVTENAWKESLLGVLEKARERAHDLDAQEEMERSMKSGLDQLDRAEVNHPETILPTHEPIRRRR